MQMHIDILVVNEVFSICTCFQHQIEIYLLSDIRVLSDDGNLTDLMFLSKLILYFASGHLTVYFEWMLEHIELVDSFRERID